jgi:hypothetical protein
MADLVIWTLKMGAIDFKSIRLSKKTSILPSEQKKLKDIFYFLNSSNLTSKKPSFDTLLAEYAQLKAFISLRPVSLDELQRLIWTYLPRKNLQYINALRILLCYSL